MVLAWRFCSSGLLVLSGVGVALLFKWLACFKWCWRGVPVKVACRQLVTPRLLKTKYLYFVPYLDNLEISQGVINP